MIWLLLQANWVYQTLVLTHRNLVNNWRNIGIFWIRLAMYVMLCICFGTCYLRLGHTWKDAYSKAAMLFYCVVSGYKVFIMISDVY